MGDVEGVKAESSSSSTGTTPPTPGRGSRRGNLDHVIGYPAGIGGLHFFKILN